MTSHLQTALKQYRAGHLKAAEDSCRRVLERDANNPGALQLMAFIRFRSGQAGEAEILVRRALAVAANNAELHNFLGVLLRESGQPLAAMEPLQTAVRLRPGYAQAWNNLGITHMDLQQPDAAEGAFHKALELQPGDAEILTNLGICMKERSDMETAEKLLREAVSISPNVDNLTGLALVLKQQRQHAAAHGFLQQALELDPDNAATWLQYVLTGGDDEPAATAIDQLTAVLDGPPRSHVDSARLHFALGRLYDRHGSFDRAFDHFNRGNLICRDRSHDPDRFARVVDDITGLCSEDWLARHLSAGHLAARPVFILGLPRSGKSLLEHLLAGHPGACALGESYAMPQTLNDLVTTLNTELHGLLQQLTPELVATIRERYSTLTGARMSADTMCALDTLPANVRYLGVIASALPDARIIVCNRDPLDTGLAMYCKYFHKGYHYAQDLAHIGTYMRHHERLMAHWRRVLPLPVLDINYADLVAHPQATVAHVLEFLGLEPDSAIDRLTGELHTRYIGHHRHYEAHLGPLKKALAG